MRPVTAWECGNGMRFDDEEACRMFERANPMVCLLGLDAKQLDEALDGTNEFLADVILMYARDIERRRSPFERGIRDFHKGLPGVIPDDLADLPPEFGQSWLEGWDEASVKARQTDGKQRLTVV